MSSPNHPTSNIKDAFSSNFPDYISASLDYFPTSPRNTPSESLNSSYGLVPIASPTLSLSHDNPHIKVMHAHDAIIPPQVPIRPPIIMPASLMLSPIFNPQEFFVPEELLPPKEQFSYILILCCLVNVDRIAPKRTTTSAAPAMTQAAIQQLVANSVAAALETQAANTANTNNANRNPEPRETPAWNSFAQSIGTEEAYKITWVEFKKLLIKKYNPRTEVQKMEDEFYHLTVKGNDLKTYEPMTTSESLMIEGIPPMTTTIITTITMITTNNIIEGRKPSRPMLLPQLKTIGMLDPTLCVRDALCITQDLVPSDVKLCCKVSLREIECFFSLVKLLPASEEGSDPEQIQRDKDMQKNMALIGKETVASQVVLAGVRETVGSQVVQQTGIQCFNCMKPKREKDYKYHKEKMLLCKQAEKGVPLQAEQANWLEDMDEKIDEQELEARYSFMAKIQEVLPADSGSDAEPLEKLDTKEKNQKQLKKANTSLAQELKKCKYTLEETNRTPGESNRGDRFENVLRFARSRTSRYSSIAG
uniref:Reverse transcriptase domain-containing protein n=1 Tax=Tanacetum cinerariifolium TaxID=118510 RepID=A0A6L2LG03_TANCI|nr:reverse transcriptase domain-containing protein [Tanacetum cinerariifolium]